MMQKKGRKRNKKNREKRVYMYSNNEKNGESMPWAPCQHCVPGQWYQIIFFSFSSFFYIKPVDTNGDSATDVAS